MGDVDELRLPPRDRDAHKGHFGRVLIVAGSRGMAGAAVLTTGACLRSGSGLVTVAAPASVIGQIAAAHPAAMTMPLPETQSGRVSLAARTKLQPRLGSFDAVAVGPGLGQSAGVTALVVWLFQHCPCPLVLDADALNAMAQAIRQRRLQWPPTNDSMSDPAFVRVLTPHLGEFRRLQAADADLPCGTVEAASMVELDELVMTLAKKLRSWIVLKGANTRMTDGSKLWRNSTGNPGLATGGSGDCLTGAMVACLASRSDTRLAVRRACYVHGLAGDLAAVDLGQHSMNAEDLGAYLPNAWKRLETEK
ncbi:MAG: NAD(P)H-hydrate dehydratase [Pirellulaceae bacterium]|nr:NAD(P)H-hydrate dehydratase [Pirellulaceae bacterium]